MCRREFDQINENEEKKIESIPNENRMDEVKKVKQKTELLLIIEKTKT